jgi:hypothetical protein
VRAQRFSLPKSSLMYPPCTSLRRFSPFERICRILESITCIASTLCHSSTPAASTNLSASQICDLIWKLRLVTLDDHPRSDLSVMVTECNGLITEVTGFPSSAWCKRKPPRNIGRPFGVVNQVNRTQILRVFSASHHGCGYGHTPVPSHAISVWMERFLTSVVNALIELTPKFPRSVVLTAFPVPPVESNVITTA